MSDPRYGSLATAHCKPCRQPTTFRWSGCESRAPRVDVWTCKVDGHVRVQMADVTDAYALCQNILERAIGSNGTDRPSRGEMEDMVGLLRTELWDLYVAWDPSRGVRFTSYATGLLRLRVNNIWRYELGRDVPKAHVGALSLDAPTDGDDGPQLEGLVAARAGDPALDLSPDLDWALAQAGGGAVQPLAPGHREPAAAAVGQRGVDRLTDARAA